MDFPFYFTHGTRKDIVAKNITAMSSLAKDRLSLYTENLGYSRRVRPPEFAAAVFSALHYTPIGGHPKGCDFQSFPSRRTLGFSCNCSHDVPERFHFSTA
jgi:hypothetical protein